MVTNVSLDNYKSPIELTETPWRTIVEEKDDKIFVSIQSEYGVRLDKDELFKALHYDRAQYQKGYADGVRDAREEIASFSLLIKCFIVLSVLSLSNEPAFRAPSFIIRSLG